MQEALEFGRYSEAADVFSFGVLLWELYHSQTSYKKTKPGFYIRPHIFPKFDEGASLPYAALTVACLHGDPNVRCASMISIYNALCCFGAAFCEALRLLVSTVAIPSSTVA